MKRGKQIFVVGLALLSLLGFGGCDKKYYTGDYFRYKAENGEICILDLTEEGKKLEVIEIPEELEGLKVTKMGVLGAPMIEARGVFESETLLKVIIPSSVKFLTYTFTSCPNLQTVVFNGYAPPGFSWQSFSEMGRGQRLFYMPVGALQYYLEKDTVINEKQFIAANTSFMYNYEGCDNGGYYRVNQYEAGETIQEPDPPKREGYRFTGWYIDEACGTPWEAGAVSEGGEVTLYAGWEIR